MSCIQRYLDFHFCTWSCVYSLELTTEGGSGGAWHRNTGGLMLTCVLH